MSLGPVGLRVNVWYPFCEETEASLPSPPTPKGKEGRCFSTPAGSRWGGREGRREGGREGGMAQWEPPPVAGLRLSCTAASILAGDLCTPE